MGQYFKCAFYGFWVEEDYLVNNTTETAHTWLKFGVCIPLVLLHTAICAL